MSTESLLRGRGVRKSSRAEFSDRMDVDVLRRATPDRKLVAARLGVSRSIVDKQIENERRTWVTVGRLWVCAAIESGAPLEVAAEPALYLRDCAYDYAGIDAPGTGDALDLMREAGDVMESCGVVCRKIGQALRNREISDSERASILAHLHRHEKEIADVRRVLSAHEEGPRLRGVKG